ncbi:MAG: hypothetical protein EOO23_04595 [Comamonadaceae bacterium]|nr:MAG: hypothetical protein EOO23_04595 [Comamonadaceae bacterium]
MTTAAAAEAYEAQHVYQYQGRPAAVFNPLGKPVAELPVIYGFNNGGSCGTYYAQLIAADGTALGGHICSAEAYMPADLGVLEGSRPDRHELFQRHYPDGYRMEFVGHADVDAHAGLFSAFAENEKLALPKESA